MNTFSRCFETYFATLFPIAASAEAGRPLFRSEIDSSDNMKLAPLNSRAHGRIIVKLNLASSDSAHHAPAMLGCELSKFLVTQRPQNSQFGRMRDENLRSRGKRRGNLCG